MKIAHLIGQFYPYFGGAEVCVHNVCCNLVHSGHQAVVVTTTPPAEQPPPVDYEIIHLFSRTCGLLRRDLIIGKWYLYWMLDRLQKKHRFDLWQVTNGYPMGIWAVDYFRKHNIPAILRCCGEDIQKVPEIEYGVRLDNKIDEYITVKYPLFNGFVALTQSVKEEYLKLDIPEDRIRIIPNGVNVSEFASRRKSNKSLNIRKDFNIDDDACLILTVGRYHPKKGFDQIPEIASKLQEKGVKFNWLVVGGDSDQLQQKFPECKNLNIRTIEKFSKSAGENVFTLPASGLIDLYCSADIFAFPTLIETFGMVLVEAMAAGLPIVTTESEGVKDVIIQNETGIKTTPGDSEEFAEAVFNLIKDDSVKKRLSENACSHVKKYDWETVTGQYIEFYKSFQDLN